MHKKLTIFILLSFTITITFCQKKMSTRQITTMKEEVEGFLGRQQPEFALALPLLLKLHDNKPQDLELNYTLGYCYINLDDERALPYLEFCLKNPNKLPEDLYFYLARAFHLEHRFEDAIKYYEKFRLTIKKPQKHQKQLDEIYHEEKMCENGMEILKESKDIEVFSLGNNINTKYAEYGPIFNANETKMIFTSCRPDTKGGAIDKFDGRYFEDIYISEKNSAGEWGVAKNIGTPINTDGNDAVVAMSPDGSKIYLYKYSHGHGDLYSSDLSEGTWSEPVKLKEPINSHSWEPSLSVGPDENTIYFTSNREGGYGGTDIYVVKKMPSGKWSKPMNLGNTINTEYDEDSPFILADGKTLYFSSNGNKSMGGFDVFSATFNNEKKEWSEPENLGYPINTAHDDLYFSISFDGKKMYFSSIHPEGNGDKDIYYANIDDKSIDILVVSGSVIDAETKEFIDVSIIIKDKSTGEKMGEYITKNGNYKLLLKEKASYTIELTSKGYRTFEDNIIVPNLPKTQLIEREFKLIKE